MTDHRHRWTVTRLVAAVRRRDGERVHILPGDDLLSLCFIGGNRCALHLTEWVVIPPGCCCSPPRSVP